MTRVNIDTKQAVQSGLPGSKLRSRSSVLLKTFSIDRLNLWYVFVSMSSSTLSFSRTGTNLRSTLRSLVFGTCEESGDRNDRG